MPPVLYIHVLIKLYRNPMKWASFSTCYRGSAVKNPPVNAEDLQEMRVQSLGWKDPLEQEMATHSNILAWEIPWTEEPGRLQSPRAYKKSQTRLSSHAHMDKYSKSPSGKL